LLNGKLSLHDVPDVENYCRRHIPAARIDLSEHDYEELLAYLIETTWELSKRYEQGRIRKGFSVWAGITLHRKVHDWQRSRYGRTVWRFKDSTYERSRPTLLPLTELDGTERAIEMDSDRDRIPDLTRLDGKRSSKAPQKTIALGDGTHGQAA
jgi:hypothetical protein